jgi:hypothetical protein
LPCALECRMLSRRAFKFFFSLLIAILFWSLPASAATPVITTSTTTLQPDTADQTVQFYIAGTDSIAGEDLNFQINDGLSGPTLSFVDIFTGSIFATNNTGNSQPGIYTDGSWPNRIAVVQTTTSAGTVVDNGLLATIKVSTVGLQSGTFHINLHGTHNGDSDLVLANGTPFAPSYSNPLFTIAPEPSSLALLLVGAGVLALRRRAPHVVHSRILAK